MKLGGFFLFLPEEVYSVVFALTLVFAGFCLMFQAKKLAVAAIVFVLANAFAPVFLDPLFEALFALLPSFSTE